MFGELLMGSPGIFCADCFGWANFGYLKSGFLENSIFVDRGGEWGIFDTIYLFYKEWNRLDFISLNKIIYVWVVM